VGEIVPQPGTLTFKVVAALTGGTTVEATQDIEVGIRTDDAIVVGWIDPNRVTLPAGADQRVTDIFPSAGPPVPSSLGCNVFVGQLSENSTMPNLMPLTNRDRSYILHWLFKFAGNADPVTVIQGGDFRAPNGSSISSAEVAAFVGTPTNYKLFNRLQIKYLVNATGGFKGAPTILQATTSIGHTENPCGAVLGLAFGILPGQAGPNNGPPATVGPTFVSIRNDGSPDAGAIRAFDTLEGKDLPPGVTPVFWENIGSNVRFDAGGGTAPTLTVQPYPTYYEFHNGMLVTTIPQAASPLGDFVTNPYPFGTVPCTRLGGTTPGGRCGDASLPRAASARIPPYTIP
jgi:hypothetical protein